MLNTVKAPKEFEPLFEKAQEYVCKYFKEMKRDETQGVIEIFGQRYILIRAAAMSVEYFDLIRDLYKEAGEDEANRIARSFLFDLAHAIGKADAKNFHEKMGLKDPLAKLSAGLVHFAYTGWAFVDIFPESKPLPDENYYLIYDHPYSFESDSWKRAGKKPDFPVCIMNSGYSSGWCEESFGIPLVASEITCTAKGDDSCRFIMSHPSKIDGYIKEYLAKNPEISKKATKYEVPGFFKRKREEEERKREAEALAKSKYLLDETGKLAAVGGWEINLVNNELTWTDTVYHIHEVSRDFKPTVETAIDFYAPEAVPIITEAVKLAIEQGRQFDLELQLITALKNRIWVRAIGQAIKENGKVVKVRGVFQDITERKRAMEELAQKVKELEKLTRIMEGREDQIIELKQKVKELEARLK